jgi:small subunit ribosomal protein S16
LAVRIRLTRVGMTKQPSYRFVVTDSRNARDGRALETLGHYNPRTDPIEINVNADRAKEWMSKGAKPSDTVDRLFRRVGVLPEKADRPAGPARGPKKAGKTTKAAKREAAAQAAPAATAAPPAGAPVEQPAAEAAEVTQAQDPAADEAAAETPVAEEAAAAEQPAAEAQATEEPAADAAQEES